MVNKIVAAVLVSGLALSSAALANEEQKVHCLTKDGKTEAVATVEACAEMGGTVVEAKTE